MEFTYIAVIIHFVKHLETIFFSLQGDGPIPENLPDWQKDIICESEEWKARSSKAKSSPSGNSSQADTDTSETF